MYSFIFLSPKPIHKLSRLPGLKLDKGEILERGAGETLSCTRNLSSLLGGRLFSFTTLTQPISRIEVAWCFDSSFACAFVP